MLASNSNLSLELFSYCWVTLTFFYSGDFDPNQDPNQQPGPEGQGDEGDVDQFFDDAGETFLPADHPLMSRLQNALTKQLTDEHERVDL